MTTMPQTFALLVAFQGKHWLADYPLQGRYMLGKFRDDWSFAKPLLAHVAVHALFTFLIAMWVLDNARPAILLALFDACVHFGMDRLKAGKKYLGRFKPLTAATAPTATPSEWRSNDRFWWAMGFDQMVHHLTHYAIIAWIGFLYGGDRG